MLVAAGELVQDRIQRYIILLVVLALAAFAVQVSVHLWVERQDARIDRELQNQLARREIGQSVDRHLLVLGGLLRRLAQSDDRRDITAIHGTLLVHIDNMRVALDVLQNGGTYLDIIDINLPGRDELRRSITYRPPPVQGYVLEVLELAPKLEELAESAHRLESLVQQRLEASEPNRGLIEERVEVLLKVTGSILLRSQENMGRVLYEAGDFARRLESESAATHDLNARIRHWVVSATLMAALALLWFVLRRVARIIAERRETQIQLERTLANTEAILEAVPVGMILVDADNRIVRANKAAASIGGFQTGSLVGRECHDLICPAERGRCPVRDLGQIVDRSEKHILTADGTGIPVYKTVRPVNIDGQHMLLEAFFDITELQEARERFRLLLDSASEGIFGFDGEGRLTFVNPAAAQLSGYAVDELQGQVVHRLIHHSMPDGSPYPHHACRMVEVLQTGQPSRVDNEVFWRKDGSSFPVEYTSTPIWRHGCIAGAVVTFTDITARREAEAAMVMARRTAEEADRAKSFFLARMSHEIRTPMNGVLGMTELLLGTDLSTRQRGFAQTIQSSGNALLAIINDILDFSKIEAGKLELESAPFDLRALCEDTLDLLAPRAQEKGLEICGLVANDLPSRVKGDPNRLRQVLINLLANAIKFTERGAIELHVRGDTTPAAGGRWYFEVRDTGIGLAPEVQERIFDAFTQETAGVDARFGGTGLGLAISRQLVRLMGGQIGVTSSPGEGSRFWFTVVLESLVGAGQRSDGQSLHGIRVLVADSHAGARRSLCTQCELFGAEATGAGSLEEVFGLSRQAAERGQVFDFLLLTRALADAAGLSQAHPSAIKGVNVVVFIRPVSDVAEDASAAPDARFELTKPVRAQALLQGLQSLLGMPVAHVGAIDVPETTATPAPARQTLALRVLVVEDNPVNQVVAEEMLLGLGCEVRIAQDGAVAVRLAGAERFDVILMDCQMPVMDGYEAARKIRQAEADAGDSSVPIVALTANAMKGARDEALDTGMNDYLTKPFTEEQLRSTIERWVDTSVPAARTRDVDQPADSTPPRASAEVLNSEALANVRRLQRPGKPDVVKKLFDLYLQSAAELMRNLGDGLEAGDADIVAKAAHTLKSSSANIGAETLAEACRSLENLARAGRMDGLREAFAVIEAEYAPVEAELIAYEAQSPDVVAAGAPGRRP